MILEIRLKEVDKLTILVLGDKSVGKSWLCQRFINKDPLERAESLFIFRKAFNKKTFNVTFVDLSKIVLGDTAIELRDYWPDIIFLCFSVVKPSTFQNLMDKWVPMVKSHFEGLPYVVIGTMKDLRTDRDTVEKLVKESQAPVTYLSGKLLSEQIKAAGYFECSSVTGDGISTLIEDIVLAIKHQQDLCSIM